MTVHMHPSSIEAGLANARAVLRAPRGTHPAQVEQDALELLLWSGDFIDNVVADQIIRARQVSDGLAQDREKLDKYRAAMKRANRYDSIATAAVIIASAFVVACLIAVGIAS